MVGPRTDLERDVRESCDRLGGAGLAVDGIVTGCEQSHVMTRERQVAGEGAGDVSQPAGLRERLDLGGEQADRKLLWHGAGYFAQRP